MNRKEKLEYFKKQYEGKIFNTNSCGDVIVLEYVNTNNVRVKFLNSGGINTTSAGNLRKGLVNDFYAKTVCGVGYLGEGKYKCRVRGRTAKVNGYRAGCMTKEYSVWDSMIRRVYGDLSEQNRRTYGDVEVCEEWHNFQNFAEWCQTQSGFGKDGYHIDKDILIRGNRVYSPEACCFVPAHINSAVTGMKHTNTTGYSGVWKDKSSYVAEITINGTGISLGSFSDADKASLMYKNIKQTYIRTLAEIYKEDIDHKVYLALKEWEVL